MSQRVRLLVLVAYLATLFAASRVALGEWFPPSTEEGLWFYAGLAALLLGNLLVTPFFTKPADAISYAASALVAVLAVDFLDSDKATLPFERTLWISLVVYLSVVIAGATGAIVLRGATGTLSQLIAADLFKFSDVFGGARPVYSAAFLFALLAFHRDSEQEFAVLLATGITVVTVQPLEYLLSWLIRFVRIARGMSIPNTIGQILARQEPGIVLVRRNAGATLDTGDLVAIRTPDREILFGLHLDWQWLAGETWARIVRLIERVLTDEERVQLGRQVRDPGTVAKLLGTPSDQPIISKLSRVPLIAERQRLVGIVAPDTDLRTMVFEVTAHEIGIEEGRLVQTRIGAQNVLFQVIDGVSREEVLQQLNRYGYARATARKIGVWNADLQRFDKARWIPLVNEPVLLLRDEKPPRDARAVGYFPGTQYPAFVRANDLVTHNTAILGILGVGKTTLALELIERIMAEKVKAICLDITSEWAKQLNCTQPRELFEKLRQAGSAGRQSYRQNKEEGGSVKAFRAGIREVLAAFLSDYLTPRAHKRLLILDPAEFEVWQQETNIYQGTAGMSTLTPTQITRIITEEVLDLEQSMGTTDGARCCIVFEEAHSLVPEWNSAAAPGDQTAANGTAKAILQGRKYGLGCLLITQRTANVTKSILNQCNTIFAMRVYDATGMEFLRNYIGDDFASVLSTMEDRHAILFGKASSCADPILIQLNDRREFLGAFGSSDLSKAS